MNVGAEGRVDGVESHAAGAGGKFYPVACQGEIPRRAVEHVHLDLLQAAPLGIVQGLPAVRGDQCHLARVGAQELGFPHPVSAGSDDRDALVGDFVAVANRAVAQPALRQGSVVQVVGHIRPAVGDAGRQQHGARKNLSGVHPGREPVLVPPQPGDQPGSRFHAVRGKMASHAGKQIGPRDAARETGLIARARNLESTAGACVDDGDPQAEPRHVERRHQAGRPGADDQAVGDCIGHHRVSCWPRGPLPPRAPLVARPPRSGADW